MSEEAQEEKEDEGHYGCPDCLSVFRLGFARCPIDGGILQRLVDDPLVGSVIADRYLIEECVGEGGMGRVYRARHQRVSRRFAIKVLFGDLATDPKMRARFSQEAEAASRLSHPNVISVTDFGETKEGLLYLVMDFVEGRELAQVIQEEGPLESKRVVSIVRQLCEGLGHAHEEGLIHRDFKGENIILSKRGDVESPRIVDFGIAVMLEEAGDRLTTEGVVIGTPATMSPEQVTGQVLDARSDLFSLGVVMYEMLAGVPPFEGEPMAVARQNLMVEAPAISSRVPGLTVDQNLEQVVHRLMQKQPEDRYQSAAEVVQALDDRAVSSPLASEGTQQLNTETVSVYAPRNRKRMLIALGVLLLGGIVGVSVLVFGGKQGSESEVAKQSPELPPQNLVSQGPSADASPAWMLDAGHDSALAKLQPSSPIGPSVKSAASGKEIESASGKEIETSGKETKPVSGKEIETSGKETKPVSGKEIETSGKETEPASGKETKPASGKETKPASGKETKPASGKETKPASGKETKPASSSELTKLYVAVGESLQKLEKKRPSESVRLRTNYLSIPFSDALRVPALRDEVEKKLRRLDRLIKKKLALP